MSSSTSFAPSRTPEGPRQDDVHAAERAAEGGDRPEREVVVGVDGSECALTAVRWAAEEAARRGAPLRIVHAAPYLGRSLEPGTLPPELPRARRITGQAYTVAKHTGPALPTDTEVVPGQPAVVLLRAAASARLLVLGIATTGAADELILAPVAQRVVARSTTPVVVVPRRRGPVSTGRPIVAVLGFGDEDDDVPVADFAADEARRSGAPLTVLHRRAGEATDWAQRYPDLTVTERPVPGGSPGAVLHAAGTTPLLVLSAGHGNLLHRLLDGPHRWLLRHCTMPMALVPPVHRPETDPREDIIAIG